MRTKLLALCLAVLGLGSFLVPTAGAHDTATSQKMAQAVAAMPAFARVNATVEIRTGHTRRAYHRPRYRTVRRVYYRHGRRVVVVQRVRY